MPKPEYSVGDQLDMNCTSSPAVPDPEITWILNGKQVSAMFQEKLTTAYREDMLEKLLSFLMKVIDKLLNSKYYLLLETRRERKLGLLEPICLVRVVPSSFVYFGLVIRKISVDVVWTYHAERNYMHRDCV